MTMVLIVDDDPQILRVLQINLMGRQYKVVTAATGNETTAAVRSAKPDLIILDVALPELDGVELLRQLRTWTQIPVIVLSGRVDSQDKVEALDAGANDYVTKPFNIDELLARVRAVTRSRTERDRPTTIAIGRYKIDFAERLITSVDGSEVSVHLTRTEWQLLEAVAREPGKLVEQRYLLKIIWGPTYETKTQYVRQYMAQLRRKLEENPTHPRHLLTESGMGYRFRP